MQFLKTLFWVVLAVIAVIFSLRNWTPVPVNLWAGLTADVKLPVLLLIGIGIGFLPTYAVCRTKLWRMRRRLDNAERNASQAAVPPVSPEPASMLAPGSES